MADTIQFDNPQASFDATGDRTPIKLSASFNTMNIKNINAYWREKHISEDFRMNSRAERVLKAVDMAFATTMQNYLKKEEPEKPAVRKTPFGFEV
jgi:hypothetical protein